MTSPDTDTPDKNAARDPASHFRAVVECLLFLGGEPLTVDRIRRVMPHVSAAGIREILDSLAAEYEARKGGFHLQAVAGGYQLRTRPEYAEYVRRFKETRPRKMRRAVMETLAVVAYRQPVLKSEIDEIRGVDAGGALRQLLEHDLIRVAGRKTLPGRPLLYATTKRFLTLFGLKDLTDLPSPEEIEAMLEPGDAPVDDGQLNLPLAKAGKANAERPSAETETPPATWPEETTGSPAESARPAPRNAEDEDDPDRG